MIKIVKPYGYIAEEYISSYWKVSSDYFVKDKFGKIYHIDQDTYEELSKDDRD